MGFQVVNDHLNAKYKDKGQGGQRGMQNVPFERKKKHQEMQFWSQTLCSSRQTFKGKLSGKWHNGVAP